MVHQAGEGEITLALRGSRTRWAGPGVGGEEFLPTTGMPMAEMPHEQDVRWRNGARVTLATLMTKVLMRWS